MRDLEENLNQRVLIEYLGAYSQHMVTPVTRVQVICVINY